MSEPSPTTWPEPFEPPQLEATLLEPPLSAAPSFEATRDRQERAEAPGCVRRMPADEPGGLPIVELVPRAPSSAPRAIGPGRRERAYLTRVAALEGDLERAEASRAEAEAEARAAQGELELVSLLERGAERRLNRAEVELEARRAAAVLQEQRENRLILALGALQHENQRLSQTLQRLRAADRLALPARASEPRPHGHGWRALLGRWIAR